MMVALALRQKGLGSDSTYVKSALKMMDDYDMQVRHDEQERVARALGMSPSLLRRILSGNLKMARQIVE